MEILNKKRLWILFIFIFSVAIILRFILLNQRELWLDELFSFAFTTCSPIELLSPKTTLPQTPFYFILLSSLPTSSPDWLFRLPSAIFGFMTVLFPTIWLIRKQMFKTALITSVLLAFNPWMIYWSIEARMYSLYGLLITILILQTVEEKISNTTWFILATLSFFTFPYAIFYLIYPFLYLIFKRKNILWGGIFSFILILLWSLFAFQHVINNSGPTTFDKLTFKMFGLFFKTFISGNFISFSRELILPLIFSALAGLIGISVPFIKAFRNKKSMEFHLILSALLPFAFYYPTQFLISLGFTFRAFFPSGILLVIVMALGIAQLKPKFIFTIVAILILSWSVILNFYFTPSYPYNWNKPRDLHYELIFKQISNDDNDGSIFYFKSFESVMASIRYMPHTNAKKYSAN